MGTWREPPKSLDPADGNRTCRHAYDSGRPHQASHRRAWLWCDQRCGRRDLRRLARRHVFRVRLCRRRRAAVRPQSARRGFHPGLPGVADRADHERVDHASVLLARPATDRAGHGMAVGAYHGRRRRSELFLVMTGGMAGIAGTVLVLYATLLAPLIPDAAAHFVIASVLGAPAAILVSLIMVPETKDQRTGGSLEDPDLKMSSTM